jgi:hypothetical protein
LGAAGEPHGEQMPSEPKTGRAIVYDNVGHYIFREREADVVREMLDFYRSIQAVAVPISNMLVHGCSPRTHACFKPCGSEATKLYRRLIAEPTWHLEDDLTEDIAEHVSAFFAVSVSGSNSAVECQLPKSTFI